MMMTTKERQSGLTAADVAAGRMLGWTSVAIGLTELLMPKKIEQTLGMGNGQNTGVLRVLGMRELATGVDLLRHRNPQPGVMARVAGDAIDGVVLAAAAKKSRNKKGYWTILALVAPVVLVDVIFCMRLWFRGRA